MSLTDTDRHWLWGCARCDGRQQVGRERGDAALARQVVADKSDLADFECFHKEFHLLPCAPALQLVGSLRGGAADGKCSGSLRFCNSR